MLLQRQIRSDIKAPMNNFKRQFSLFLLLSICTVFLFAGQVHIHADADHIPHHCQTCFVKSQGQSIIENAKNPIPEAIFGLSAYLVTHYRIFTKTVDTRQTSRAPPSV